MGLITDPYDFTGGTPAVADQVDERFTRLYNLVNGQLDENNLNMAAITSFLRLFTPATRKIKWGSSDNGGNSWGIAPDREFDIAHGLGGVPVWWIAWGKTAVSTADAKDPTIVSKVSEDGTNLRVKQSTLFRGNCNFPGATVYWVAII